jgi:hypothetical protein
MGNQIYLRLRLRGGAELFVCDLQNEDFVTITEVKCTAPCRKLIKRIPEVLGHEVSWHEIFDLNREQWNGP